MDYRRIIAHTDLDGISSAAMALLLHGKLDIAFSGPVDINMRKMPLQVTDIIVDLPYGTPAGLWYDHHEGNTEDVKLLGLDPDSIPGVRKVYPSCAGLMYDTFKDSHPFPAYIPELIEGVNRVDSFAYADISDWRRDTPERWVDMALKFEHPSRRDQFAFMRELAHRMAETPVTDLAKAPDIVAMAKRSMENEEKAVTLIGKFLKFADADKRFLLLDFSEYKQPLRINRSLAFLVEPTADVVIAILPLFNNGVKSTDLMFSMSLAIHAGAMGYDVGDIVRTLNIGDGHAGAASGKVESKGKDAMLKAKDKTLEFILKTLRSQVSGLPLP